MTESRCRWPDWQQHQMTAQQAVKLIRNGMTIGMSGFAGTGTPHAFPRALAQRIMELPLTIDLLTGGALGHDIDKQLADAGAVKRRAPFQADNTLRRAINSGHVMYTDSHPAKQAEQLRSGHLGPVDMAVIEACALTEDGYIVPTTSVDNAALFAQQARHIIIEINHSVPAELEGLHDIYMPRARPGRRPIPIVKPHERIGTPHIPIDADKIAAIILTEPAPKPDGTPTASSVNEVYPAIAEQLCRFVQGEVDAGRLDTTLAPLQLDAGPLADAVLTEMGNQGFEALQLYTQVLGASALDMLASGTLASASATALKLADDDREQAAAKLASHRHRIVLRPQEISHSPEVIQRLGVIAINPALEIDIYGNVNGSHMSGNRVVNGIGGAGDFARHASLSIFVAPSTSQDGHISTFVPFVSHVDHTEHEVDIVVSEHGYADLRGLAPRERARKIISHCTDPSFRKALNDYFALACESGGHTPHRLDKAFAWHHHLAEHGTMKPVDEPSFS